MLQVGLTGSIASGKSHAAGVFAELGAHVIDADIIAHQLFAPHTETFSKVVQAFGDGILTPEGAINRTLLGDIIFKDRERRLLLNALVHPDVRVEVIRRIFERERLGLGGVVIVDAALMIESGFYKMQDRLIVVFCEPALQLARIMSRTSLSAAEARLRIDSQLPLEEKLKLADYVIDTSGTYGGTRKQIERIYGELLELARRCAEADPPDPGSLP